MNSSEICPGRSKCPHRTKSSRRDAVILLVNVLLIGSSWGLVVSIEHRAPTIIEVGLAMTCVMSLATDKKEFLCTIRSILKVALHK